MLCIKAVFPGVYSSGPRDSGMAPRMEREQRLGLDDRGGPRSKRSDESN